MMLRKACYMAAAAMVTLTAVPANAATFLFNLTGSRNATFRIDTSVPPASFSSSFIGDQFAFRDVSGVFNGTPGIASNISFGNSLIARLNINAPGLGFTQFTGPVLFTGSPGAPTFNTGTFQLTSIVSGASTLSISAVPEPGTWALMIAGFGMIGGAMRVSRRKVRVAFA